MGHYRLDWNTYNSKWPHLVEPSSDSGIYTVYFPEIYQWVNNPGETDNLKEGIRIQQLRDAQGNILISNTFGTVFTTEALAATPHLDIPMVNGERYQAIMWATDNTGFAVTTFKSVTVSIGGLISGSMRETTTLPPPIGTGGNSTLSLQVAQSGSSINFSAQLSPAQSGQLVNVTVDGNFSGLAMTTDSAGTATGSLSASSLIAGQHMAIAYLDASPTVSSGSVTFTVAPTQSGIGSISLAADNPQISDVDNTVMFAVEVKSTSGTPLAGIGVYAIIDGLQGNAPSASTDGTGKTSFPLTFADPSKNHTIQVTAGGVNSNTVTVGPNGGGIIGSLGKYGPWLILGAIGLVALSSRSGGTKVIRV